MLVYIIMLVLSVILSMVAQKYKNNKKIYVLFAIFSAIPFIIVTAIRYDVGTDYFYRYIYDYNLLQAGQKVTNLEIGFKFIHKIALLLNNSQLIFVISAIFITSFIFFTIYRDSKNPITSIILYFIGAFFFQSLNMVRQYMAMSVILCSYKYIINREWIKFSICMITSILFHVTSIIFIAIILLIYLINKIMKKNIHVDIRIVIPLILLLVLCEPVIRNLIYFVLSGTRFKTYINSIYDHGDLQIIPFTINLTLYLWMIYITKKYKNNDISKINFFINMQIFALICIALGKTSMLALRLAYYFSIFQIISIPYFLNKIKKISKKEYMAYLTIIVIIFSSSLLWTHVIHNADEVLPYKTIYTKDSNKFK